VEKPTLRQLEAFTHVYRLGSLTRAAQVMHLTQSAMSVLLQQLEEVLGLRLFDRTSRSLRPTAAAHEVYETAQRILGEVGQLVAGARGLAEKRRGVLHFGVATSVAATILPEVLLKFKTRYPGIRPVVHDMGPDRLLAPVLERTVEFSIGTPDTRNSALHFEPLLQDSLGVICRTDHPLAAQKEISWKQLAGEDLITVRRDNAIRVLVDTAMQEAGTAFEPAWEVSYFSTALALTARGLGISVLPGHLVTFTGNPVLITRPLIDPQVERNLYLITSREHGLSPAAEAMVDMLRKTLDAREAGVAGDMHD